MITKITQGDIKQTSADAMVLSMFEGDKKCTGVISEVDEALNGAISQIISSGEFKAKCDQISIIHSLGKLPVRIIAVVGLGKRQEFGLDKVRNTTAEVCRILRKLNCRRITLLPLSEVVHNIKLVDLVEVYAEASLLGLYSFDKYKKPDYTTVEELLIVSNNINEPKDLRSAINKGIIVAKSTNLARDMVNEPANNMTPSRIAEIAKEIASDQNMKLEVLEVSDMKSLGMGALLGAAKGSQEPPKLVVLSYQGDNSSEDTIGFIGKGVTFDSGGISLKPSAGMDEMKDDMAGAAAVLAAISGIAQLCPKVNVTAVIPTIENLPSGTAFRPSDILKSMNGKTIEIISTDAEGRLILADALCYAINKGASPLIDLATLTGACRVALGTGYAGAFSNNKKLMENINKAASKTGEHLWQLPLPEEYKKLNKSHIADIKNVGDKYAGAISAALFLAEFVDSKPWAHLDIAGVAASSVDNGYIVEGATGFGVRMLIEFALSLARKEN
jgi:leucyl aminopeptidase